MVTGVGNGRLRRPINVTIDEDGTRLRTVVGEHRITELLVGLPLHADGTLSPQARRTFEWATEIARTLELPLLFVDERYSSQRAEASLGRAPRGSNGGAPGPARREARRAAVEGFVAMAPDLLVPLGGTPKDEDQAREMFPKLNLDQTGDALAKLVSDLKARNPRAKIFAMGFCWGGGMVNILATKAPNLDAAASYYGVAPKIEEAGKIKAQMMLHLGALDDRVNATIPPYEEALKKAGVKYEVFRYEGANHAFNNDTAAERYHKASADLAWSRTMAMFKAKLAP